MFRADGYSFSARSVRSYLEQEKKCFFRYFSASVMKRSNHRTGQSVSLKEIWLFKGVGDTCSSWFYSSPWLPYWPKQRQILWKRALIAARLVGFTYEGIKLQNWPIDYCSHTLSMHKAQILSNISYSSNTISLKNSANLTCCITSNFLCEKSWLKNDNNNWWDQDLNLQPYILWPITLHNHAIKEIECLTAIQKCRI